MARDNTTDTLAIIIMTIILIILAILSKWIFK